MDAGEKKTLANIEAFGCHVVHVVEEAGEPSFAYSVGIQRTSRAPEVIVVGLERSAAQCLIHEYNERVKRGERFTPGARYDDFLEEQPVQFERLGSAHRAEYMGWDSWLYRGEVFDALQIVYPTTTGVWPWDANAPPRFVEQQPLLFPKHL